MDKPGAAIREGTRTIGEDGRVYVQHGQTQESANLTATEESKVKDMMAIRDAAKKVVDIQVGKNCRKWLLTPALESLRSKYKAYVLANGALNSTANAELMDKRPGCTILKGIGGHQRDEQPVKEICSESDIRMDVKLSRARYR